MIFSTALFVVKVYLRARLRYAFG